MKLIRTMAAEGLLSGYEREGTPLMGAAVDMRTFRLPRAPSVYLANQLLWGPGFFVSSAFTMATIVKRILKHMYSTVDGL